MTKNKHKIDCCFNPVVNIFNRSKNDVPSRFGLVTMTYKRITFVSQDDVPEYIPFKYCPECGVLLIKPKTEKVS